jgi:TP901 family phage tail tape measure protein
VLPFFYYKHRAREKMAGRFVLTAQLQVQAPTNLTQVRRQIQQQLSNVTINPQINTQALANFQNQLNNTNKAAQNANKNLRNASRSASSLGASLGAAARRFASITLATGAFLALARGISEAFGRAIEFERELIKISQVTGKSVSSLKGLTAEVTRLSTSLGASSAELLNASRTLSQAGFSATKAKQALEILAQTDLGATFENIADTTEGAIALLRQFRKEAAASGGDIAFLGKSIDAITAVSKNFAVEASDLIAVIRRTGGVFEAAGGKINELIALFTSVRGTTRETAETIATGFRTIFTRIQRTETIDQLRELGIVLQDSSGKFVGPLEAIRKLSLALGALDPRDFRFSQIVEQLGGFRQVGKVIPLIKQYSTSAEALAIANNSMGETARDAQKAQHASQTVTHSKVWLEVLYN